MEARQGSIKRGQHSTLSAGQLSQPCIGHLSGADKISHCDLAIAESFIQKLVIGHRVNCFQYRACCRCAGIDGHLHVDAQQRPFRNSACRKWLGRSVKPPLHPLMKNMRIDREGDQYVAVQQPSHAAGSDSMRATSSEVNDARPLEIGNPRRLDRECAIEATGVRLLCRSRRAR